MKRDIEVMLRELREDVPKFGGIYLDSMNREQCEFFLDRELTETLLTGYSATLRRAVIARSREPEAAVAPPGASGIEPPGHLAHALDGEQHAPVAEKAEVGESRRKRAMPGD